MTSTTIIPNDTPTGEQSAVTDAPRRGGWISDGSRPPGRHRADRPGLRHVTAIEGIELGRRRVPGAVVAESILARLIPGGGAR